MGIAHNHNFDNFHPIVDGAFEFGIAAHRAELIDLVGSAHPTISTGDRGIIAPDFNQVSGLIMTTPAKPTTSAKRTSPAKELEARLASLEQEMTEVRQLLAAGQSIGTAVSPLEPASRPWWEKMAGSFADDPYFDEVERLGREWRRSTVPYDQSPSP